jgi:excinuclease ABC subunit B
MQRSIDETNRHREKQIRYNQEHGIVPRQIVKSTEAILGQTSVIDLAAEQSAEYYVAPSATVYKEPEEKKVYRSKEEIKKALNAAHRNMQKAAKELDYMAAAIYRDEVKYLQQLLENR